MSRKYVVIGGVACGPKAASRLRRLDPEAEITIIEKSDIVSYGGCGLPYYLSGDVQDLEELWATPVGVPRDPNFFKKVKDIKVLNNCLAEKIDRNKKIVKVVNLKTNEKEEIPYDKLVLAVGSTPNVPKIKGIDLKNVFKLYHPNDALNIKKIIDKGSVKEAVIVGGGLIGLEVAEALTKQNIKVTVLEMMDRLCPKLLDKEMSLLLMNDMKKNNVDILVNTRLLEIEGDNNGNVTHVVTDKGKLNAQLVLISIGVRPNTKLAEEIGLELTENKAIKVNEYFQTSDPDIYAGGDCIDNYNLAYDMRLYTPLGDLANIHGRIIANNIFGKNEKFNGTVGTSICKVFDFNVATVGMTEENARRAGKDVLTVLSPSPDKAHFYPTGKPIFIKLIAEKENGKILGAQIVGYGDVAKRINMVSMGLYYGITTKELAKMDFAYAPPFSPAMDNLIVASNILQNKIDGIAKSISILEVKEKLDKKEDFILLDVRGPQEVENMSLPYENVKYIPLGALREKYIELPKDKEIIAFCKISLRGYEAQKILEGKGFNNVKFMDGGILAWPFEKTIK